jgi:hypothetical protein
MTDEDAGETKPVSYYGKKLYYLNPKIARRKPAQEVMPDYSEEEHKLSDTANLLKQRK